MKLKSLVLSAALVAVAGVASAQQAKKGNDIFVGAGAGINTVFAGGMDSPSFYGQIMVGKYISPVWGVRAVVGGPFQTLDQHDNNAFWNGTSGAHYSKSNKLFGEINLDGMVNFTNIFAEDLSKFDVYMFMGPTVNFSTRGTAFTGHVADSDAYIVEESDAFRARVGATVGLGFAYNFTKSFALGVEARGAITPSIFGDASAYRKGEGTGRLTLNAIWSIGGKNGKYARAAAAAAAAGYISKEAAEALAAEAVAKNPKIVEKIVEKEVIKEVEKLVNGNVPASTAVFFEIGKATLTAKDKARLSLFADALKQADAVFEVGGYADKKTGSANFNMSLSEKRANAVYNYLISEGVPASKLEKKFYGGVDKLFNNNTVLCRTVIVKAK